jgi:hypothetical protein
MKYQMRKCETRSRNSSAHPNGVLEEGRAEMGNSNVQVCVTHKTIYEGSWFLHGRKRKPFRNKRSWWKSAKHPHCRENLNPLVFCVKNIRKYRNQQDLGSTSRYCSCLGMVHVDPCVSSLAELEAQVGSGICL